MDKYQLIEERELLDIHSKGLLYRHGKSGAQVAFLLNKDENRTFSIAFKTPPLDDTGLPHILEHSVLCGSRKYPVKDPFVELAKGSLNTFLNAMTYPDKTVYPVASCNQQDLRNLADVYMDAVLHPNIYANDKILAQEGWHHELDSEEGEVTYKGVVYNEMKGAFSSPEQVLFRKIQQSLFPDTAYGNESGGDPDQITRLTQEDFLEYHRTYYHPSNSYIYFYGDVDVEEKLEWLDREYLQDYEAREVDAELGSQAAFEGLREIVEHYPVSEEEDGEDKTFLSLNFVAGNTLHTEEVLGMEILEHLLLDVPGAPLKQALIDAGIGSDVFGAYDDGILQPTFSIVAKDAKGSQKDAFLSIIRQVLEKVLEEGISPKKIESALNHFEFRVREADFGRSPKGVVYAIKALDSWLHGESPFLHFELDKIFGSIRKSIPEGFLYSLIRKYLLDNNHATLLVLEPDPTLLARKEEETRTLLAAYKEGLDEEEVRALVRRTRELAEYQTREERPEDVEKIPLLTRADIPLDPAPFTYQVEDHAGAQVLVHHADSNGIVYLDLAFDMGHLEARDLPYAALLTKLLGKVSTDQRHYSDLSDEVNLHTGGISLSTNVYSVVTQEPGKPCRSILALEGKAFVDKMDKLLELVEEILFRTDLSDHGRIQELLAESKSRLQSGLTSSGHTTALIRAESYVSEAAWRIEQMKGISYYEQLGGWLAAYEEQAPALQARLEETAKGLFVRKGMVAALTLEEEAQAKVEPALKAFLDRLPEKAPREGKGLDLPALLQVRNEGFKTASKVQYVAQVGDFKSHGYQYHGGLRVLQTILGLDYLWNQIRVQGGAYGAMCGFKQNGDMYMVSYRDPNLEKTLETYGRIPDYLRNLKLDDRETTKYILGTISAVDHPLTPSLEGEKALALHLSGKTMELLAKERREILSTTQGTLQGFAEWFEKAFAEPVLCVVGNETAIRKAEGLFKETKVLK
ncbi:insulinase family protein [Anaerotalea alkaliphila]|uniref:Insulinase family protein n=1 Tax=Anaerotalea alkaliphila TaxID=2662126 RepID=A0A7X5KP08_9FIRM|nr:insulinase family protein [Anaerotalea alkaliphila]NDL68388.1 insulinase family protein [Anaerotalea alkaliphila]